MADRHRRSGRRTDFRWALGAHNALAFSAGNSQSAVFSGSDTLAQTLYRTRGEIMCSVDGAQAPGGLIRVGWGLLL